MKRTIRTKIMLMVFIPVIAAFLISGIGASQYFYSILESHTVMGEDQKLAQTARQLQYIQNNVINIAKQIVIDGQVQNLLREERNEDVLESLITERSVKQTLRTYINQFSYIYGVTIVSRKLDSYSSNQTEGKFNPDEEEWYRKFKETGLYKGFSAPHLYTLEQGIQKKQVVSYIMSFKDIRNGKDILGDIILHAGVPEMEKYAKLDTGLLSGYALYDREGDAILHNGTISQSFTAMKQQDSGQIHLANKNTVLVNRSLEDGWMMVSEVSNTLLLKQLKYIKWFFAAIFLGAISILAVVLYFCIRNITKPLEQLHTAAVQVGKGDFEIAVDIRTNDELMVLGEAFNTMVADIKRRMEESIQYEKTTKEMEINRLMLQINPHFIYNTLNSIVYMAQIEGNKEIVKFSNAFISLLQDTLRVQKDSIFISMEQELKNIKNYLVLQSYRYPGRFDVIYDVEESVYQAAVPNVLIQPIVENAIFHGLAGKTEKGILEIIICRIRGVRDDIQITIRDNGLGMTEDVVSGILNQEETIQGQMRTIGVGNVKSRIEHIYGKPSISMEQDKLEKDTDCQSYGMDIKSTPGKGTEVILNIPFLELDELIKDE